MEKTTTRTRETTDDDDDDDDGVKPAFDHAFALKMLVDSRNAGAF